MITGPFTATQNAQIETALSELFTALVGIILRRLETARVESIGLRGAFATGEGTVLWQEGKMVFLSDIDLVVCTQMPVARSVLKTLDADMSHLFSAEIQIEVLAGPSRMPHGMWIRQIDDASRWRVIWGEKRPRQSDVALPSIPESEAVFLIFNRIAGLMATFLQPIDVFPICWYQTVKAVLAVGDALLIVKRCYYPGLLAKMPIVRQTATENGIQGLALLYEQAVNWKLCPPDESGINSATSWVQLAMKGVSRYALQIEEIRMGESFPDWLSYSCAFESRCGEIAPVSILGRFGAFKSLRLNWQAYGKTFSPVRLSRYLHRGDSMLLLSAFLLFDYQLSPRQALLDRAMELLNLKPSGSAENDWERSCCKLVEIWKAYVL